MVKDYISRNDNYFFYLHDTLLKMQILKHPTTPCYCLNVWECDTNNRAIFNKLRYSYEADWTNKKLDRDLCVHLIVTEFRHNTYFQPWEIKIPLESEQDTFRLLYG